MKFYIQLDSNDVIRDCIEYSYGDYIEVEMSTPLPIGLLGGWYKWDGENPVYDRELFEEVNELESLKEKSEALDEALAILQGIEGGE